MRRAAVLALLAVLGACGGTATREPPEPERLQPPTPPDAFAQVVDNPWLSWRPGSRWVYRSSGERETRIVTTVTHRTRVVDGVRCVVVHDVESTLGGKVLEDTWDWYAQDSAGNVWYFGEDTTAYDEGKPSKEGSWEAGADGARPGIVMLAKPEVGRAYLQEYKEGEAEDQGAVITLTGQHAGVPGRYGDLLVTRDTTRLEPKLEERKYYARGVGVVYEETVTGGDEQVRLVSYRR